MSYYNVMGYLVDVVVERISAEVLALQDITEAESEKLNELLRVLHPLEKIFTESDPVCSPFATSLSLITVLYPLFPPYSHT